MELRQLAKNVYAILTELGDPRGDSNFGLIIGNNGVALIDADIRRWVETRRFIESVTEQPVRYLINTHDNFDHTSANTLLARQGAVIISSKACRSIMSMTGREEFKEKMSQDVKLWGKYEVAELSVPDLTTDGQLCLNLGESNLEISFLGHAHTPGDMVVYLPGEEILFAGDVLFNGCHPVTRSANTSNWVNVLAKLKQKSIKLTVPGHGDPSIGKSNLDNLQNYFEVFRARVGELKASGLSVEEVEESFALPEFESWGKKNWLPVSIKKIYSELV